MVQYSVKKSRGRKIKKYRKSRRGKGRGKRSLKGGKTRRYKVFKNTRRHTLGKRKGKGRGRRMMGGGNPLTRVMLDIFYSTTHDKVIKYINEKYKKNFEKNGIPEEGFTKLQVCYVEIDKNRTQKHRFAVLLKNTSSIFSKYEKCYLYVFACFADVDSLYPDTPVCYALVRVGLQDNVNDKILFIFQGKSEGKNPHCPDIKEFPADCMEMVSDSSCFTFKSFISSEGDSYSLVIPWAYEPKQKAFNEMFQNII